METIVEKSKYRIPTAWKEEIKETIRYKTRDGRTFDSSSAALSHEKKLEEKEEFLSTIETANGFDTMNGNYYFVHSEDEVKKLIDVLGYPKTNAVNDIENFPCWIYIEYNDGGDYTPWSCISHGKQLYDYLKEVKQSIDIIYSKIEGSRV